MRSYSVPKTFEEFELVCVEYLRREWKRPKLKRYVKSGYGQHGVDIVDLEEVHDCWAAQCKLHEYGKPLQAAEVVAEVAKAEGFPVRIRRYAVCTTGKKTPHAVETIGSLSAERVAAGKFGVELIYWEDIELRLEQDDEFRERYLGSTHESVRGAVRSELDQGLARGLEPLKAQLAELAAGTGTSALDAELDRAKRLLDAHDFGTGEALLRELKDKKYDQLTGLQRFRCLANLGVIEYQRGNDAAAGAFLLKAAEAYPEHEKALANRAQAYNLLGKPEEAWEAIKAARSANADDRQVAAAYSAFAPPDFGAEELAAELGESVSDPLVTLALADRCLRAGNYIDALDIIARLKHGDQESYDSRFVEARAMVVPCLPDDPRDEIYDPAARTAIEAALSLLDRSAREAEQAGDRRAALSARLAHLEFVATLGELDLTERSLDEAARLAVVSPRAAAGVEIMRSQLALREGRFGRAIDYAARALTFGDNVDAAMLHAVGMLNRGQGADRENARREIRKLLPRLNGTHLEQAMNVMLTDLLAQRSYELAIDAVQQAEAAGAESASALAQRARIAIAQEDRTRAVGLTKQAASALSASSTASTRRMIGAFSRQFGELEIAIEVLQPLSSKNFLTNDTKAFLAVAMDAKRHDLVTEWCAELWTHHALDAAARWNYLYLLDRYDAVAGLQKTEEAIAEETEPRELAALKARRALVQRRLSRPVVNITVADLPQPTEVAVHYVNLFVEALLLAGLRADAVEFAYRSVLRFPDDPGAHASLIRCFLFAREADDPLVEVPEVVRIGAAVEVLERDSPSTWFTIEKEYVPALKDVVPDSLPWVQRLLGARAGDVVSLAEGAMAPRTMLVRTIEAAVVHRYRDSMHTWQMRFPDHPLLEEYQLPRDAEGELDFTPLLNLFKKIAEDGKRFDELYRGGTVAISLMAERAGRSIFQIMEHLTRDDDLFVNCVHADSDVSQEALVTLKNARGIVLDGTAIWTLRELGELDILKIFPIPFGTTQQAFDFLRKESSESREGKTDSSSATGTSWQAAETALTAGRTLSTEALAALRADRREELVLIGGEWAAHSMAAAKQHGFVLWSDDRVLEVLSKEFFAVSRVWTQAVLFWLQGMGLLDDERVRRASARLQAFRYSGTFIDGGVLVQAARLADWNLTSTIFQHNLRVLGSPSTELRACAGMALALISACMTDVRLSASQTHIIASILGCLKKRDPSLRVVLHVRQLIPIAMRVNPIGANQAFAIVTAWLKTN